MRLDEAVLGLGVCRSRSNARRLIIEGRVKVDGITVTKPGTEYRGGVIDVRADRYVSRAGEKLEAALERFKIDPAGKYVVDFGASTGGFTDCLLAHGAEYVWAVDVGTAQLAPKLRDDPRVKVLEKTDGRNVTPVLLGRIADMAVMDVSFISQSLLYPAAASVLPCGGCLVTLIKPQFEVGRGAVGKGGIVRDMHAVRECIARLTETAYRSGFAIEDTAESPVKGGDGNTEYLAWFRKEH